MHSTQEAEGGLVSGVNRQVAYWQDGQGSDPPDRT